MGRFMIFLAFVMLLLLIINIYLCKRFGSLANNYKLEKIYGHAISICLCFGLAVFIFSLFLQTWIYQNRALSIAVKYISSFYISMVIYSFLLFITGDLIEYLGSFLRIPKKIELCFSRIYAHGLIVPIVAVLITFYAFYNAVDFKITSYEISINKKSSIPSLNAVMISDLHVGTSIGKNEIEEIKTMIEKLSPQILFICGDIFDQDSSEEIMKLSAKKLGSIKTEYGTYFVTGNHEYYLGNMTKILSYFNNTGIKVLQDEMITIKEIQVVGRKDIHAKERALLSKILNGADKNKPIIILDHQPNTIDESIDNGADLQLSGHTHNGQLFPFNYIVRLVNHSHYGIVESGNFKAIVTSGIGTWKYPIRTGSPSEIVSIKIKFLKKIDIHSVIRHTQL